jgi:hypothetical protein
MQYVGWLAHRRRLPAIAGLILGLALLHAAMPAALARPAAGPFSGCWTAFPASGDVIVPGGAGALAALGPDDVWAANIYGLFHWSGAGWQRTTMPIAGYFTDLAARSATDIWATGTESNPPNRALLAHWDGRQWTIMDPGLPQFSLLRAVVAPAADNVWAAGSYRTAGGTDETLTLHWDGHTWARVPSPNPGQAPAGVGSAVIYDLAAARPDDMWAVGQDRAFGPLLLHWDGQAWQAATVTTTNPMPIAQMVMTGPGAGWAVVQSSGSLIVLRLGPQGWRSTNLAPPGNGTATLSALAAGGPNDIWAGGTGALFHWDGQAWQRVPGPISETIPGYAPAYSALAVAPDGTLWASGTYGEEGTAQSSGFFARHSETPCAPAPSGSGFPAPPVALPGAGNRLFPETNQAVSGRFLDYWTGHGGLAQQGYPISPLFGEVSDLNGKAYTVQYFERAVFEYHPENAGTPYDVLLSQLGTFRYKQKYPQGAPGQVPNQADHGRLFAETGHWVGGKFRDYWESHGGLAQQGYPISDEFQEVSDLNGQRYTVQYFERAVFEYHPENQPPYNVLLSQLGKFQFDAKYSAGPATSPTPAAGSRLVADSLVIAAPLVAGHYVFWADTRAGNSSLYGYDADTSRTFLLADSPGEKGPLAGDGRWVAWVERSLAGAYTLRSYDLTNGQAVTVLADLPGAPAFAVGDGVLYYSDPRTSPASYHVRTLATGQTQSVPPFGQQPVAAGTALVWFDVQSGGTHGQDVTWTLHLRLLGETTDRVLDTAQGQGLAPSRGIAVSGDSVIWSRPQGPTLLYTISTGITQNISLLARVQPHILGNQVVWTNLTPGTEVSQVRTWAIQSFTLPAGTVNLVVPATTQHTVAWGLLPSGAVVYTIDNPVSGRRELRIR